MEEKQAFKKGDKVICTNSFLASLLHVGNTYTVELIDQSSSADVKVSIIGVEEHLGYRFDANRFELCKEEDNSAINKKVYIVDNGDKCFFGVFSNKEKAQYVCDQLNDNYPDDDSPCFIEERELDCVKSWIVNKKLEDLKIKVVANDSY